ncbi:hypothetical protein D3C86_2076760 [compost metagenome]
MMAFMGVRISWLMLAMKSPLTCASLAASCCASCSRRRLRTSAATPAPNSNSSMAQVTEMLPQM